MTAADLIAFFIEEAEHQVIEEERTNQAESALLAHSTKAIAKPEKPSKHGNKSSGTVCENCNKSGHNKANCWSKGGDKEGQGPHSKKNKSSKKNTATSTESAVVAVNDDLFAFTCTSDFRDANKDLDGTKSQIEAIIDSGASRHFTPNKAKLINFKPISSNPIKAADARTFKAEGMGDLPIHLPNEKGKTKTILKNAVYSSELAFTLISINCLDDACCKALFKSGVCTIKDSKSHIMAKVPKSNGLFRVIEEVIDMNVDYANIVLVTMSISDAHRKLGHISHRAIGHSIWNKLVTGIEIDPNSKPEFCEPCAKAKANRLPFPQASETQATKFGEHVHWDLWGSAPV